MIGIADQRERQLMLLAKLLMRSLRINADTDYLIAGVEQILIAVAQTARLSRAAAVLSFG